MRDQAKTEEHYRKLERLYHTAPINGFYAPELKVSEGHSEIVFEIHPKMHHAAHAVHGSVYFKALDDAAFFAANSLVADVFVLTASFTIYFLRPVSSGRLKATGWVAHQAGRQFVAEAQLEDEDGNQIARGSGIFVRSKIALSPEVGYV
jgi:uncharacterized protein (TIGR00369 family)